MGADAVPGGPRSRLARGTGPKIYNSARAGAARKARAGQLPSRGNARERESTRQKADDERVVDGAGRNDCR